MEDKNELVNLTLLANFTHQVINPLNGVAGTLDNIIDLTVGENRREQRTKAARAQLEGVVALVRNLAYLSSPQFEASRPIRQIVIPQVIIEAAMYYQEEGASKGISIDLVDRKTQNRIFGHPEAIRQVLMNIFDNAVKYSKKESIVEVSQWVQSKTDNVIITIKNTPSSPISQIDIDKIFDLGFRGGNAKKTIASGTGLGLYICKYLIEERMSGSISVQAEKGDLTFMIKIPQS